MLLTANRETGQKNQNSLFALTNSEYKGDNIIAL